LTWVVAPDPTIAAISDNVFVVRTDIPHLPDEINYEAIVGDSFANLSKTASRIIDMVVIVTTPLGFEMLKDVDRNREALGPKTVAGMVGEAMKDRQAVVMRWQY
jgi:hypothetical protein